MKIRLAGLDDIEQMDRIALAAKASWGYADELLARWREELRTPPATILVRPSFVAVVDKAIAGFAQIDPTRSPWTLESLFVSPAHMGQGIGRALIQQSVLTAQAAGERVILIDADPNAAGFYRACGATLVGTLAAPIPGDPLRLRPQFELSTGSN